MENGSPAPVLIDLFLGKARHNSRGLWFAFSFFLLSICHRSAFAQSQHESATEFAKFAIKLRENGLLTITSDGFADGALWQYL